MQRKIIMLLACGCWLWFGVSTSTAQTDCAPTRLEPWVQAQVPEGQGTNRLRNAPGLNGALLGEIPVRVPVDILDGPTCADGILWWEVESRGERGFTAETDGETYFLERIESACLPSELLPGGAAYLTEVNARDVDLYRRPRLEAAFEPTTVSRVDTLYLTEQSVCAQDARWWRVSAADGSSGWVIETQQQARNLSPAPRLERGDVGVLVERSTEPPPSLADYTLAYVNEPPRNPFAVTMLDVFVHPLDGEPQQISEDVIEFREDVYWSPDGTQVAYQRGDEVVIVAVADMTRQTVDLPSKEFMGWSPDGEALMWKDLDETIESYVWGVIDRETGASRTLAPGGRHALARWVDANTFELMNRAEDGAFVIATVTIDPLSVTEQPLPAWTREVDNWAFAPDGRIAFEFGGRLVVMDPQTNTLRTVFSMGRVQEYAWSPDGDRIAVIAGFDDVPFVIDVDSLETIPLLPVDGGSIRASAPLRWSHDGALLAYRHINQSLVVQPADGSARPTVLVENYSGGVFPEDIRFRSTGAP